VGTVDRKASAAGLVLLTLSAGQFLMMLDSSVMNVSIATVAKDVGTTVTGIQTAITLYTLVMASFMITGGKIGRSSAASAPSRSGASSTAAGPSPPRSRRTWACC
jgi:MFS family permease